LEKRNAAISDCAPLKKKYNATVQPFVASTVWSWPLVLEWSPLLNHAVAMISAKNMQVFWQPLPDERSTADHT
jgi:hypothetical protein